MSTLSIILIVVIVLLGSFIAVRLSSTAAREARAVRATDVADAALEKQLGKAIQAEEAYEAGFNALVALGATLQPAGHAHRIFQIAMATLDALAVVSDLMERGERGAKAAQANRDYNAIRKALFTMGDPLLSSDPAYPVYHAGLTALRALVVLVREGAKVGPAFGAAGAAMNAELKARHGERAPAAAFRGAQQEHRKA